MSSYIGFQLDFTLGKCTFHTSGRHRFDSFMYSHVPSQAAGFWKHPCVTHWFWPWNTSDQLFSEAFQFHKSSWHWLYWTWSVLSEHSLCDFFFPFGSFNSLHNILCWESIFSTTDVNSSSELLLCATCFM